MAKYESQLRGDFNEFLDKIEDGILNGSISASYENGSDFRDNGICCAVRVYERYSVIGSNRVSLSITLIGKDNDLFVSAITAGGSQAMFFKLNTLGEKAFLQCAVDIIEKYKNNHNQ